LHIKLFLFVKHEFSESHHIIIISSESSRSQKRTFYFTDLVNMLQTWFFLVFRTKILNNQHFFLIYLQFLTMKALSSYLHLAQIMITVEGH